MNSKKGLKADTEDSYSFNRNHPIGNEREPISILEEEGPITKRSENFHFPENVKDTLQSER